MEQLKIKGVMVFKDSFSLPIILILLRDLFVHLERILDIVNRLRPMLSPQVLVKSFICLDLHNQVDFLTKKLTINFSCLEAQLYCKICNKRAK